MCCRKVLLLRRGTGRQGWRSASMLWYIQSSCSNRNYIHLGGCRAASLGLLPTVASITPSTQVGPPGWGSQHRSWCPFQPVCAQAALVASHLAGHPCRQKQKSCPVSDEESLSLGTVPVKVETCAGHFAILLPAWTKEIKRASCCSLLSLLPSHQVHVWKQPPRDKLPF